MNVPLPMPTIRVKPHRCRFDAVYEGIWEIVRRNHRPGENDFETVQRMLVNEALATFGGEQKAAGDALGVSSRRMNYLTQNLGVRPCDVEGRPKRVLRPRRKP